MTTGAPLESGPSGPPAAEEPDTYGPVAETRRRVIVATADLVDRLTYRAVTVDAVARASGVSRSTIYRHWPSRQQLVLEAFTYATDQLTAVRDTGDAFADLRTYLSRLAYCLQHGGAASTVTGMIADAVYDEEFARSLRATMIRSRRREFLAILIRGQQRGQVRHDVDLATAVDALYGAFHHRLLVTGKPIDETFLASLHVLAAAALRADPAPPTGDGRGPLRG